MSIPPYAWASILGPVDTGDKVERTFDIRATKITTFDKVDRVEHVQRRQCRPRQIGDK